MTHIIDFADGIPAGFAWLNPPAAFHTGSGLQLTTKSKSDFWQRTHYGFMRDDGHALLRSFSGDFTIETSVQFRPKHRYDQCGLMVRFDDENWIKVATEFEDATHSRLGSVVTNHGWSDWATQDISSAHTRMSYRITRRHADFVLENSLNGRDWHQMRICHLAAGFETVHAGIYACCPNGDSFCCSFEHLTTTNTSTVEYNHTT